jgi:phage-related protein
MNERIKAIEFRGSSLDALRDFPITVRRELGYKLDLVQRGVAPGDWKPMTSVGKGVREIRVRDTAGAFRVLYVTKLADIIYVLHCFQKKTQTTNQTDLDIAGKRYRELMKEIAL